MDKIKIKFAGMDENAGALLVQFSTPDAPQNIDEAPMYPFFPWQFQSDDIEKLLPHIAVFGQGILGHQQQQQQHKFTPEQKGKFSLLIGTDRVTEIQSVAQPNPTTPYDPNTQDASVQIDNLRCTILEILAEEGLIPGAVKKA
jgi:hypothetical protein